MGEWEEALRTNKENLEGWKYGRLEGWVMAPFGPIVYAFGEMII